MEPLSEYQELHVISDLHIGGVAPFQIFDQGDLLAQTIDHLRDQSPNKQVALLINGDMVDFLAEDKAKYFDPIGAVGKLDRIFRDPAFAPVWDALQRFVQKNKRTLIINLGNHDLELALPWVREHLLDQLSGGNDRARGRIILSLDGAGCLCRVGRAKVLCVHGNEVDTWNVTDYEMLRRQGRELNQGRDVKEWTPNAGAKLVIDVMNDIKREYPFVDLLKPEVEAVVPVLYALKPSLVSKIGAVMSVGTRLAWDAVRRMSGFLGEEETAPDAEAAEVDPRQAMESLLRETFVTSPQQYSDADALLRAAEERLEGGSTTSVNVRGGEDQYLGLPTAFMNWIRGRDKSEILREALEGVGKGQQFDLKHADSLYRRLDELIGVDIDFLLAGHSHLERAMIRQDGERFYYNSGTWVRLIRLTSDVLGSGKQFEKIYKKLAEGTMKALDETPHLVLRKPAVVSITTDASGTTGRLQRVNLAGTEPLLSTIEGSEFTRS